MNSLLKRTSLYERHVAGGGKIVPFAGFEMPVQYQTGIIAEHAAVRETAGLFDVSHMGEFIVRGPQALELVQHVTVNDASKIEVGQAQYSAMCLESGGIIDDLLIYRFADRFMLVVNAANREKDLEWIQQHADTFDVELEDVSEGTALIALQGPAAREILQPLTKPDVNSIEYYRFSEGEVANVPAVISGTGYTGEDGFELYTAAEDASKVWDALLSAGSSDGLIPAGLGARDSLRLEMGYSLYGNDLDENHTTLESGLGWITKLDKDDFVGRNALIEQKENGVARRLVGMKLEGRAFPRPGYSIVSNGEAVGQITSGTMSPSLGVGIALGYVPSEMAKIDTVLQIDVRGRLADGRVQRPPFYTDSSIRR
tara:strand:- start:3284 stop:4393 length:1110 start_codon:yes stop_codon:yes gene_type:complete